MPLAQRLLDLVSIPSPTGEEDALLAWLEAWARDRIGPAAVSRIGRNLVVRPPARPGRPLLGLFGHMDTVPAHPDQPLGRFEGRVWGCGASDMKAGLALMMAALEEHDRHGCDLYAVFYYGEEGPDAGNGLREVVPHLPELDLALVLEPTDNQLEAGCMGNLQITATVTGQRAHSARPWQGQSALYRALPLLARLRDLPRREVVVEGLSFYEVITPTTARTFNARNVVPDRLELNLNVRFAPGHTAEAALARLRELVGDGASLEVLDSAPAGAVCLSHQAVTGWRERCGLEARPKQAWTDLARLSALGIPSVHFSPGDPARAHQADEWVDEAALEEGWRRLRILLQEVYG